MTWEIGLKTGATGEDWEFSGEYPDQQSAIVALTMKLGVALLGEQEANGTWSVKRCDDLSVVAVIRQTPAVAPPKSPGLQGPLRRWRGLTWVGWLNTLFLQFLGVRLIYCVEEDNSISGWGYCFAWPLANKIGRFRRLTKKRLHKCDHGVTFDEDLCYQAHRAFRAAIAVCTPEEQAKGEAAFTREVRHRWPRLDGPCPKGCGYCGIAYASTAHYIMGDW